MGVMGVACFRAAASAPSLLMIDRRSMFATSPTRTTTPESYTPLAIICPSTNMSVLWLQPSDLEEMPALVSTEQRTDARRWNME
jgi:hypothetical protein